MARMWVLVGDVTTGGGSVVTGSPFTDIDGRSVARVNDMATCLKHQGTFPILDGDSTMIVDGQPVALHGSSLACGCKVLAFQQSRVFVETGVSRASRAGTTTAEGPRVVPAHAAGGASSSNYDEGFVLRSSLTGKPLAHRGYRIMHADGRCETGITDQHGATHIVVSDCCERVRIELEEEGP